MRFYSHALSLVTMNLISVSKFLTVLALAQSIFLSAQAQPENPCELPFKKMQDTRADRPAKETPYFEISDAQNTAPNVHPQYRQRFIVADLNTKNSRNQCKGVEEFYPRLDDTDFAAAAFPELANSATREHFLTSLQDPYYQSPSKIPPIVMAEGKRYCTGQTVSLCEIRGDEVVEVARLATSSQMSSADPTLYVPYNVINLRGWADPLARTYQKADARRDSEMGGVAPRMSTGAIPVKYISGGGWIMPHFMRWIPEEGMPTTKAVMGLHQLAQGESNVYVPGAPVSHGCFRLSRYGAALTRWWTPYGAKMFIHYDSGKYRQRP